MNAGEDKVEAEMEVARFLEAHPDLTTVEAFVVDINGVPRGKRLPASALTRLHEKDLFLPASTLLLDIWGNEVDGTGLVFDTGDADHPCRPVPGSLRPQPWNPRRAAQVILAMYTPDGNPFPADPRHILQSIVQRFLDRGQQPVVACELEFRLFREEPDARGRPRPAGPEDSQLYGLDEFQALDALLADIESACAAQGIPADTLIAEQSRGQYEINLQHVANPLLAADHALLFKRTVKGMARRHGLRASFMAKPFGDESGNGMHVHASLIDDEGTNLFAGDAERGSEMLEWAIGGLMDTMAEAMPLFAPHANSYRRFQPRAHAPTAPTWGYDNRTTAVRVPLSSPEATRIEHRVAGADANPYLAVAAILAGMDYGIEQRLAPPPETHGSAFEQTSRGLPGNWEAAIEGFATSRFIADYFGETYQQWFVACKRQEIERFREEVHPLEYTTYLESV